MPLEFRVWDDGIVGVVPARETHLEVRDFLDLGVSRKVEVLLRVDDTLCGGQSGWGWGSANGRSAGEKPALERHRDGKAGAHVGPETTSSRHAPRKRYLYTSLRFFLGISMMN